MFRDLIQGNDEQDLAYGQHVVIAARWILVAAGLLLALWNPADLADLRIQIMVILGLAVANFYLHAQLLMRKPVITPIAYAASATDLVAISLIVLAGEGFGSHLFVFYLPAILAISVAFNTPATMAFTGVAVLMYAMIGAPAIDGSTGAVALMRVLIIVGVAVCGNTYWRMERDRRRALEQPQSEVDSGRDQDVLVVGAGES